MTSERKYGKFYNKKLGIIRGLKEAIIVALALVIVFSFIVGISRVSGSSMEPTLHDGQPVFFIRLQKDYSRGDIASVRMPSDDWIVKRIVAVAGDSVDIQGGTVYINGSPLQDGFGYTEAGEFNSYPLVLQEGQVFVLGDNREISVDSRAFGPIASSQTKGRIVLY